MTRATGSLWKQVLFFRQRKSRVLAAEPESFTSTSWADTQFGSRKLEFRVLLEKNVNPRKDRRFYRRAEDKSRDEWFRSADASWVNDRSLIGGSQTLCSSFEFSLFSASHQARPPLRQTRWVCLGVSLLVDRVTLEVTLGWAVCWEGRCQRVPFCWFECTCFCRGAAERTEGGD